MRLIISHFLHSHLTTAILILFSLLVLSACNNENINEKKLSEREASIHAREAELATLFSELAAQKESLESEQAKAHKDNEPLNAETPQPDCLPVPAIENTSAGKIEAPLEKIDNKIVLGNREYVYLDPPGIELTARIDTGARTSSLNAMTLMEFERDGKPYVKFTIKNPQTGEPIEITRRLRRIAKIKERGDREAQERPVVKMRVTVGSITELIDFTLENRSKFKHQVLIGRNLLRDLAIVDVSRSYLTKKFENPIPENSTK